MPPLDARIAAEPSDRLEPAGAPGGSRRDGVRLTLRDATAQIHQTLHGHPAFVRLLGCALTASDYRALLARLYGFHWPLERGLRTAPGGVAGDLDLRGRERAADLRADLRHLGMTAQDIRVIPLCDALKPVQSHAELLGRLYVVEGSGLGGRVMAQRLGGLLGPRARAGRRFFLGRAAPDPLPWGAFCRRLEAQAGSADLEAMTSSAEQTFRAMADWLDEDRFDA